MNNLAGLEQGLRIEVGASVSSVAVRLPRSMLKAVDMWAQANAITRAEALRRLIFTGALYTRLDG